MTYRMRFKRLERIFFMPNFAASTNDKRSLTYCDKQPNGKALRGLELRREWEANRYFESEPLTDAEIIDSI